MVYALVKIKDGANIYQDMRFGRWEVLDDEPEKDNPVFVAEKKTDKRYDCVWECRCNGYGNTKKEGEKYDHTAYGNGSITVLGGGCVEMLTPLLSYEPDIPNDTSL